ncbi:MAG: glutamine synthetase III, partial [Erysipelotrichaceae bacterium]|nr:glutamine synthetase III [Erysipelotrichaceae bacterium]
MRARLSSDVYHSLRDTINKGKKLDLSVANAVAAAMCDWAVENGATHFCHWFQPLSGATAEKHESFIATAGGGKVILEFSGSNLIKGEPDASSFPSGGLRDTFEARGYTAWDPTSYAFLKDGILCIPTVFCAYSGEALDHKTPLLRSMEALNREAMNVLRFFGNEGVDHVKTTAGPEQEYFLVDKTIYDQREDLFFTGMTLLGAMPPKGQEMDDHYFGPIKTRVSGFMKELNEELWALGIQAKTEHNEVAPSQHELATIFLTSNVSSDQNNLVMEVMKRVARKNGLECLLHEKPFLGVNGSGKHNNWSMKTDTGVNLLEPGDTPVENAQFLTFLSAVIRAVDEYQDLLRISISSAGNDHRLGASEAPPAIVSMFLGDELTEILESIENETGYQSRKKTPMKVGVHTIPAFPKDNTDRNRTSPFAFTGNKFEFRMPGSSASIATPNTVLNTVVAEELRKIAEELSLEPDLNKAVTNVVRKTMKEHGRIIFNGNGYDRNWVKEAKRRGLHNYPSTPDALVHYLDPQNVDVFTRHHVLTETELRSRYEIYLEKYHKTIRIEALTLVDMLQKDILPSVSRYVTALSENLLKREKLGLSTEGSYERKNLAAVLSLTDGIVSDLEMLKGELDKKESGDHLKISFHYRKKVIPLMESIREKADELERIVGREYWPIPTYKELLFGVD